MVAYCKLKSWESQLASEYWIIYRGPDFFAVVWFGSSPRPSPPHSPVSKLSPFLSIPVWRRLSLLAGGGGGAKSDDRENPGSLEIIQYSLVPA